MLADFNQHDAPKYEQALIALEDFVGAESIRPAGQGRTDAVLLWEPMWITVEAKSEQKSERMLSMDYVRQAKHPAGLGRRRPRS